MYLFLIITLGLLLRIYFIGQHDFWFDEAFTYAIAKLPLKDLITASLYDNNPPIYYLVIHFLLKFSNNEFVLRFPSLIFGLVTIFAVFLLAKKLFYKKVAYGASFLFAVSPLAVYQSTEARMYALTTLMLTLTVISFVNLKKSSKLLPYLVFTAFFLASFFTQVYSILLLIPLNLIVLSQKKLYKLKLWFLSQVVIILATASWFWTFLVYTHSGCGICPHTLFSLPATLAAPAISGVGIVSMRSFFNLPLVISAFFTLSASLLFFIFLKGLQKFDLTAKIYLTIITFLSLLGLVWSVFSPKAAGIFSPLFFIIAASGVFSLRNTWQKATLTVLGIFLIIVVIVQKEYTPLKGEPIKKSSKALENLINYSQPVAHTSLVTFYSFNYYVPNFEHFLIVNNPLPQGLLTKIGGQPVQPDKIQANTFWLVDVPKWNDRVEVERNKINLKRNFKIEEEIKIGSISLGKLLGK